MHQGGITDTVGGISCLLLYKVWCLYHDGEFQQTFRNKDACCIFMLEIFCT